MRIMQRPALVVVRIAIAVALFVAAVTGTTFAAASEITSPQTTAAAPAGVQAEIDDLVRHGATQIGPTQVSWNNGAVMEDLAPQASATVNTLAATGTIHGCPSDWYCFYDLANFGGRRLQFHDCSLAGLIQYLSTYGFANRTTTWVNNTFHEVDVHQGTGGLLWIEMNHKTSSPQVPAYQNNKANKFICYS
jgi:hypothetical protein